MIPNRAWVFQVASQTGRAQLRRPMGRRGYATVQERVALSSTTTWQIAAVTVAVPGLLYLRSAHPHGTGEPRHGEVDPKTRTRANKPVVGGATDIATEAKSTASDVKTFAVEKLKEGIEKTQVPELGNTSGTTPGDTVAPSASSYAQGTSAQMGSPLADQVQNMGNKEASQRANPT
ncbi:hypothetical protein B0J18DRAFT_464477 [Chaetomium sp. MPI-SDFR-AT-0129]|nr:hypothetical protein B0J18DRAFT_464477 [Chaetomium sp. MPI-SDFR-AT-0129]